MARDVVEVLREAIESARRIVNSDGTEFVALRGDDARAILELLEVGEKYSNDPEDADGCERAALCHLQCCCTFENKWLRAKEVRRG